ncbi:MAG: cellulase family glycosylhydrolase [Melioribacteraceae bacterium]|jgi:endoglucanase|nr:cellulase family glycosylhydrolase [Melioribacteraceae bacterium]
MKRRDFIKTGGLITAVGLSGFSYDNLKKKSFKNVRNNNFANYKGFNLTEKTGGNLRKKFNEQDFEIMTELGFNFARIPMSYWNWSTKEDWFSIDEEVIKDIDEVIEFGKQYKIHINLNFHRIPGYCINGRNLEPFDLFDDTPDNMQKALNGAVYHWKYFARRYQGISNDILTFDLINEPPPMKDETRYIEIIKALVENIREEDPERLIVVDGKDIGRNPVLGIADMGLVQSTRGYDPMSVSHFTATWVPKHEFETFNFPTWPLKADNGKLWDKEALREKLIKSWQPVVEQGIQVHVGEWGCYNKTPHHVALQWMRDLLSLWKEANWGYSMWNLKGDFGILNSGRADVAYEDYKGHKLDRQMLELLREFH